MSTLVWLRTDLRLHDNPAFSAAQGHGGPMMAMFLMAPEQWRLHGDAPVKKDFWLRNLYSLSKALAHLNIPLKLVNVQTWKQAPQALAAFCAKHQICRVHANAEWGVNECRRDAAVASELKQDGIDLTLHPGPSLLIPGSVLTGKGEPYRVFTPFAKVCRERLRTALPIAAPTLKVQKSLPCSPDPLPEHVDDDTADISDALRAMWPAGETAAQKRLDTFMDESIALYQERRDFPGISGTSALSPYLAAGVLSVGQCLRAALAVNRGEIDSGGLGVRTWIRELLWREFYLHLLAAYPLLSMHQPMREKTRSIPWRSAPDELLAWQEGRTGIPIVDAAQRQLLACGWMHNRLRMISAMFLSKNLLMDWRVGEAWFMANLIDGDLATNNGGWQWSASTGADAVPYFRIFNPISQSRKFDPQARFLRRWLPELADLDDKAIHDPSPIERAACGYPVPIVDLKKSRLRALEAFSR